MRQDLSKCVNFLKSSILLRPKLCRFVTFSTNGFCVLLCLYTQTFQHESWILVSNLIIKHVKGVISKLTTNSFFTISTTNWEAQWGMYEYLPIHWALPQILLYTLCCWPFGRRIFCFGRPPSPLNPNSPTLACHLQKLAILSLERMRKDRLWSSAPNSTHL